MAPDPADEYPDAASLFTVTNPPRTVAVTVQLDGRIDHVRLSSTVTELTDVELAEEVVVVAGLARQDARSAQYTAALNGMQELGHDAAGTRDFLTRNLGLPSPEDVRAARSEIFATRYLGENVD